MVPLAAFFLTYLLVVSTTDQISVNITAVQKLVGYNYALENSELLPGMRYNNAINVFWSVNDSALRGLDGQVVTVKVTATAANGSNIQFLQPAGFPQDSAEAYLQCAVENGTCSNISNLTAQIPFTISIKEGQATEESITIKSEVIGSTVIFGTAEAQKSADSLLDSIRSAFAQNESAQANGNAAQKASSSGNPRPNANSSNGSDKNFLDSLKPEGDSKNPMEFLRSNPIISIAALAIVIVITGAYLINAKD